MRRCLFLLIALAAAFAAGGPGAAQPRRPAKEILNFASLAEGQAHATISRNRIEIARSPTQAKRWDRVTRCYCSWGDFEDVSLVGVFYAGRADVRVTKAIAGGTALVLSLAVSPRPSAGGAYAVIALPRRALLRVNTVEVHDAVEADLQDLPRVPDIKEPDVTIQKHARPHAGRVFTAAYAQFANPTGYLVTHVDCRASIGGKVERLGDFKRLRGARLLAHPIARKTYTDDGYLESFSCSWRLPRDAAGKLFTLGQNECYDDCASGFMFGLAVAANDRARGGYDTGWSGWNWRVAR
jgi:hypothetical protein